MKRNSPPVFAMLNIWWLTQGDITEQRDAAYAPASLLMRTRQRYRAATPCLFYVLKPLPWWAAANWLYRFSTLSRYLNDLIDSDEMSPPETFSFCAATAHAITDYHHDHVRSARFIEDDYASIGIIDFLYTRAGREVAFISRQESRAF